MSLLFGLGSDGWLEVYLFLIEYYMKCFLVVENCWVVVLDEFGIGVIFDWVKLEVDDLLLDKKWGVV